MTLTIGSLFSGYDGISLAINEVLGPAEPIWFAEVEAAPSRVLAFHWPHVPNLGDVTKVDWSTVARPDIICGGSPCQDVSTAGARAGMTDGTRSNLWQEMREAIAVLRPRLVVWENVRGALSAKADSQVESCEGCLGDGSGTVLRALGRVLGDLASLGYDAEWRGVRASDVGAAHGRFRVFVVAHAAGQPWAEWRPAVAGETAFGRAFGESGRCDDELVADTNHPGSQGQESAERHVLPVRGAAADTGGERHGGGQNPGRVGPVDREDEESPRQQQRARPEPVDRGPEAWGKYWPAIRRWTGVIGRPSPEPTEPAPRGGRRLSARFTEWLMGLPDGFVTGVPGVSRNAQLKMLGNGVVPQQCAYALRLIFASLDIEKDGTQFVAV